MVLFQGHIKIYYLFIYLKKVYISWPTWNPQHGQEDDPNEILIHVVFAHPHHAAAAPPPLSFPRLIFFVGKKEY